MAFIVGEVVAPINADSSGFHEAVREVERAGQNLAKNISTQMTDIGKSISEAGRKLSATLTPAITGAGIAVFKLGKDFESEMSKIVGLVGVAQEQVDEWGRDILLMAPQLGKAPKELASALFFITSAGIRGAEAMDVLEKSAKASAAGLGDTNTIADLVTSAVNAYGVENLNAAQATDILVAAVREGKAEASELAATMGSVLPIASEMGVSFDQVGAAQAAMTRTGTDAASAATQLKAILTALLKPSKQAEEALMDMGTSSAELRKQIRDEGLPAALTNIRNLTHEYGEEIMATVFPNVRALMGVLDLMGANVEDNIEIFDALKDATGALDHAFEAASETAEFKWQQVLGELQATAIAFFGTLKEIAVPILEKVSESLSKVAEWFGNLSPEMQKNVFLAAGLAAALGPVLVVVGTLISSIGAIIGVLSGVTAPVLIVIGAIAGLVALFTHLWKTNETFREGLINAWEKIKEIAMPIIEMFKESIARMVEAIQPVWETLKETFQDLLPILEIIGVVVGAVFAVVLGVITGVVNGIINALAPLIDAIGGLISFITNIVNAIIALFKGDFTGAWEYLKKAGEGIITFFKGLVEAIIGFIRGLVEGVVNFFKNLYHALVGGSIIPDLIKSIINWWLSLPSRLFEIAKDMINKVVTGIQERVAAVKGVVSGLISDIVKFFTDLPKKALEWGKGLIKSFVDGVKSTVGSVTSAIGGVAGKIRDFLPFSPAKEGPLRRLPDFGSYILKPIEEVERGAAVRLGRALAHAVPQIDPGSFSAHSSTSVNITHSGVISVQGINSQGELVGVVPVVIDALRNDPRLQQALNEANYRISQSRGRPLGVFA